MVIKIGDMAYSDDEVAISADGAIYAVERSDPLTVETVNNHIYFYSSVNTDRCLALIKQLRELDTDFRNEYLSRNLPEGHPQTPIWLHIHSGGGDLFTGFSVADQMKQIDTPVYSIVEGYCASAATTISMACDKRFIQPSAFMLIHQLRSIAWGTYEELKDDMHLNDMTMEKLVEFYKANSKLKRKEIKRLLKRDSWFRAHECVELGLVDAILEA